MGNVYNGLADIDIDEMNTEIDNVDIDNGDKDNKHIDKHIDRHYSTKENNIIKNNYLSMTNAELVLEINKISKVKRTLYSICNQKIKLGCVLARGRPKKQ